MLFSGLADVEEWYDDADCYRIQVGVSNKLFGKLFGYYGFFRPAWCELAPSDSPAYALPVRHESRDKVTFGKTSFLFSLWICNLRPPSAASSWLGLGY